jgi:hypothetical protein
MLDKHVRDRRSDPLARRGRKEQRAGADRLAGALIGDAGERVDDEPAFVHDCDLKPDLSLRGDELVDRRLALCLKIYAQRENRQVVWLKLSPLRNPRPRTGRTRKTIARLAARWVNAPSRTA